MIAIDSCSLEWGCITRMGVHMKKRTRSLLVHIYKSADADPHNFLSRVFEILNT